MTRSDIVYINPGHVSYPGGLDAWRSPIGKGNPTPNAPTLSAIGNVESLEKDAIALFCSVKCPGDLILKTYDLAQLWRDADVTVISGFHSSMEKECLRFLMRGHQPIIHCLARSLETMRLSAEQKTAIAQGRLLLLSPFPAKYKRMTATLAEKRNRVVGAIASQIFIAYADSEGKTERFAQDCYSQGKQIMTFASPNTKNLRQMGATVLSLETLKAQQSKPSTPPD